MNSAQKRASIVTERLSESLKGWDVDGLIRDLSGPNLPKGIIPVEIFVALLWSDRRAEIEAEISRRLAELDKKN
ncbi:MAG: hypothetical protein RKO25_06515 [Candidatus Contendobacter sp.]|nr:hypothetical protein [Candidatus Contendobacter sp.]